MKKVKLFCFLIFYSVMATAQQDPMYTQYMFNGLVLNPAYAGSLGMLAGTALYRNQWTGMDGAPISQTLSVHAPLNKDKIGVGLTLVHDKIGVTNTTNIQASYAYAIQTGAGKLALGIQSGIIQYKTDFSKIQFIDQANESVTGSSSQLLKASFGAGIYYYSDKFYVGISSPRLGSFRPVKDSLYNPAMVSHYYFSTGMVFDLANSLKLKPSLLLKIVQGTPIQLDLNSTIYYKDLIGVGISYRSFESLAGLIQCRILKNILIGYSYDYGVTGGLQKYNSGSHEIMVQFVLSLKKDKIISPRYF